MRAYFSRVSSVLSAPDLEGWQQLFGKRFFLALVIFLVFFFPVFNCYRLYNQVGWVHSQAENRWVFMRTGFLPDGVLSFDSEPRKFRPAVVKKTASAPGLPSPIHWSIPPGLDPEIARKMKIPAPLLAQVNNRAAVIKSGRVKAEVDKKRVSVPRQKFTPNPRSGKYGFREVDGKKVLVRL